MPQRMEESSHESSAIQPGVERVEGSAGLDDIGHENGEHAVGFDGVVLVEVHLEHLALVGVHRRLVKLLGIHFSQTLESLDVEAALADFENLRKDFGNCED